MLRVEVTDSSTNQRSNVEFFDDDTIDTVRQQIGKTLQVHPDRLMILVKVERPKDYYKNPLHWEALFNRLSMTGKYIERSAFSEYQTFTRTPATSIVFEEIDRSEWMEVPESIKDLHEGDFSEYMIFGVPEEISFILPRKYEAFNIPASQYPIPDLSALVSTMYDDIRGFYCIPFTEDAEAVKLVYFPFLRDTTPQMLMHEEVALLDNNTEKIEKLLALKCPKPSKVSIVRTRFHIPWIETDFGKAIQARFEQIFFGLTVSETVPCITLFTSSNEISRHKFFTKTKKDSFLDLAIWNSWWNNTKPSRSRPTLVLYRGKDNQYFDRISITSIDMVVSTYRPEGNSETMEDLVVGVQEWMKEFDSILPFVAENDLGLERWNLQDMSFLATYSQKIESYDLRRFGCINSVFDVAGDSVFRFLRTDFSVQGVSAIEMKLLQLLKSNPNLDVREVSSELSVSIERARELLHNILKLINEKPDILQKAIRGFPTMKFGPNTILLSSTNRMEKSLQYANILRHILSDEDSDELDEVCPKRMETVKPQVFKPEEVEVADEFMDLIGDMDVKAAEPIEIEEEDAEPEVEKVLVKGDRKTMYNYFNARLQKFDPETYDTNNPDYKYPKKCEQKHQPIILSDEDFKRLKDTPYDPISYDSPKMVLENGIVICPEYWCIRDDIPLRHGQLVDNECPMCHGKVKYNAKQNPQEFTVIKRDAEFKYPRLTKYKSPTNGNLMPCCYKTPEMGGKDVSEDKYYILGETKIDVPPLRISFIPKVIIDALYLNETYESFKTQARLQSAMGGYFRVGLGRPSETLPILLGIKTTIASPREKPEIAMKCSFFPTWSRLEDGDDPLKRRIGGMDEAFKKGEFSTVQELEYTALSLNCDVFRISGKAFECFSGLKKYKGILVLQDGGVFTVVSQVHRTGNSISFKTNIYKDFKETTQNELKKLQASSCHTAIPSFEETKAAMTEIGGDYSVILDPYMRGQALYVPGKVILPFQATSFVDDLPKVNGFENVKVPEHSEVLKYLDIASKYSSGFAWAEDMYNGTQLVEVQLKSGLRIPVMPKEVKHEPTEVIDTVSSVGEKNMTFGEKETLKGNYQEISYATEVFEFLLFELSKNDEIKEALKNPTRKSLEPELRNWFNTATRVVDISKPTEFISKIRTPCGQFKGNSCSGNVCGWDGKTCRIQIKKTLQKEALFHRLLGTLVDNAKIRSTVLDERVTPFFSTILYMELPHELILTDLEVKA